MEQVRIHPAPAQPGGPPIIVAGRKDPAMARAARLGDGWMPYLYSPRAYGESVRRIRELADQDGRDLSRFEWMVFLFTNVGEDADAAREEVAGFLGGTYSQDFRQFVDRVAAAGTVEQVAARVQEYVDAGVRHVIFAAGSRTDRRGVMERIMTEVTPRVRAGPAPP
jgi:alkanesulfonate monooxygenase SsuD/methylene tetrahydromethanopterin reductase-like flavin-dependent oxidoreductase (luciferase family)